MESLPPDHFVKSQAFTRVTHQDVYPAIDPTQDKLSQAGKVIIVTGASRGIGARGFTKQFARAHPKAIILVARDATKLAETEKLIRQYNSQVQLLSVPTEVTDENTVKALFEKVKQHFGHADVLVNNAGVVSSYPSPGIAKVDTGEWWKNFVNIKGTFLVTKYFLQLLNEKPATVINLTSWAGLLIMSGGSAYTISKLAIIQLTAYIAAENPNVSAIALHPGLVETDMLSGALAHFDHDSPELAASIAAWLASDEAKFMSGRYTNANWDVEELTARRDEIVKEDLLKIFLSGKFGAQQFD